MCNYVLFFFFNDTATTEIYTLSLHDALPIWAELRQAGPDHGHALGPARARMDGRPAATAQPRRPAALGDGPAVDRAVAGPARGAGVHAFRPRAAGLGLHGPGVPRAAACG